MKVMYIALLFNINLCYNNHDLKNPLPVFGEYYPFLHKASFIQYSL
jgi:hypothetical protein